MTWNHRIIHKLVKGDDVPFTDEDWYEIHEVYYNDDGSLMGYSETLEGHGEAVCGATLVEMRQTWARIGEAFEKPVLKVSDFPKCQDSPTDVLLPGEYEPMSIVRYLGNEGHPEFDYATPGADYVFVGEIKDMKGHGLFWAMSDNGTPCPERGLILGDVHDFRFVLKEEHTLEISIPQGLEE